MAPPDASRRNRDVDECPTVAHLGAFLDGALTDAERGDLQAHLATCRDCRATVADAHELLRTTRDGLSRPRMLWLAVAAALVAITGTAAALVLQQRSRHSLTTPLIAALAAEPRRSVDALLSGGFEYAPPPRHTRGESASPPSAAVALAARETIERATKQDTPVALAAAGVAHLVVGEFDDAVNSLGRAARQSPDNADYLNNLAAVHLARARAIGDRDDWTRALVASERAVTLAASMPQARFNRALALEGLGDYRHAAEAWALFQTMTQSGEARAEAAERERVASARARE